MNYKYQKGQIFGKRLKVPKYILNKVYNCTLSFNEYIEYQLDDKIPISCIIESDRKIVERFGVQKSKKLDWDLINTSTYNNTINIKDILMSIDPHEDINQVLYELVKDKIRPNQYSPRMAKIYSDRLFEVSQMEDYDLFDTRESSLRYLKMNFNAGNISLIEIIENWDLFKDKDLSYCLLKDENNKNHITSNMIKEFMNNYGLLVPLIVEHNDIYSFITNVTNFSTEEERNNYIKQITDEILNNTHRKYGDTRPPIELTDEQYKEIFKYSSMEDYLKTFHYGYLPENFIKELKELPKDYLFNIPIPFSDLLNSRVLSFVSTYGLRNVVDFDIECGHFFTKNNCEMLKLMDDMYLHYGGNIHDPNRTIYTKNNIDENGNYVDRPYTKDEFYEAMRRMIVYGPTDWDYVDKAPDYREMTGEFRVRNKELFISEKAPDELQKLFYTKSITPQLLLEHPEYIQYIEGKDLSSCFKNREIQIIDNDGIHVYENIYKFLSSKTDFKNVIDFITEYSHVLDIVFNRRMTDYYKYEIDFRNEDDINKIQSRIDEDFRKIIIEKGVVYPLHIPKSLIKKYPSMFLDKNAPKELQEAFYSRTITSEFIQNNPSYRDYLNDVDLEVLFKYMPVGIKPKYDNDLDSIGPFGYRRRYHQINFINALQDTFGKKEALNLMINYGKYIEKVYESNNLKDFLYDPDFTQDELLDKLDESILQNIIAGNMKYDENMPSHFKNNNPSFFLDENVSQEIKNKFYNREFTLKDFNDNPELLDVFDNTNIACAFPETMSWIIPLFSDSNNIKIANYNRMKVITSYSKIEDVELKKAFKEYIIEYGNNIDIEKIEYVSEVLLRLSLSNSSEIFTFRKELASQILKSNNPIESLNKIEDIFIRNNIPTVGKIYSCFDILHPNFQGFNFESSMVSPVLKRSSTTTKRIIVFSDLIKASFGSNNRSVNTYLKNIEFGSSLYESIKRGEIQYDSLEEDQIRELTIFSNHLATLYNNTMKAKKDNISFIPTGDVLEDIQELSKRLSPNGTLDYDLANRVIRMFCGFTGISTIGEAKEYVERKVKTADSRNRQAANSDMVLEQGDFVKGIGDITYLRNILQNGSVSKEYLGSSASSDSTPLDTDISMIMSQNGTISDKINGTAAASYGPIWFVLKNDDRFITTRTQNENLPAKRDMSKMEVFYTGVLGQDHYGIRTGFASSEINYIVMENYDPRVGLEIAMNGFYIPVANKDGKIVFTPEDYEKLRTKMSGLSYFGENNYIFSNNLVTEEIKSISQQIEQNDNEIRNKREKINSIIKKSLQELGLNLKTTIDGDLTEGYVELIDTGSTGRGTNKPGDGDFDFMMRLDRSILSNPSKLNELKQTILRNLGRENSNEIISTGDFRLKNVQIDANTIVDIDITFTEKTDKVSYSTDMALKDRLDTIKRIDPEKYKYVVANILLAKKVLKEANVYKPNRGENPQGGLGGVGIENWILQNGGSFIDAAKSFIEASDGLNFSQFQSSYQIWDFGDNHLAERRGLYSHDNFITNNMSEDGYQKMVTALKNYVKSIEKSQIYNDNIK